jgi:hypothetical protein
MTGMPCVEKETVMNLSLLIPLLTTTVVAIGGWLVGHRQNLNRDRKAQHRELRLRYLLDAYRSLESFAGREPPPYSPHHVEALERAVGDIQLLGEMPQIDAVIQFYEEKKQRGEASLDPIINALRAELRNELGLLPVDRNVIWLRIKREDLAPS